MSGGSSHPLFVWWCPRLPIPYPVLGWYWCGGCSGVHVLCGWGCYEGESDDVFFLEFAWVSVGHGIVGGAVASFGGPLPGSGSLPIAYEAGSYEQVKRFLDPVYAADQDAAFMCGVLEAFHSGRWFIGGETSVR